MMIQKNLELQLQALNMIEQKYGLTPASLVYETDGFLDDELVMEDLIQYVIRNILIYSIFVNICIVQEFEKLKIRFLCRRK